MTEQFKLPGSSIEELNKIIMGYASLDKPSTLGDVSTATSVSETTVSRNSGFLVSIGVIESGAKKSPTEIGRRLGKALTYEVDEEVQQTLAEIVSETDFLKSIVGAVRIRRGMDDRSLRSHISFSSGAKKNAQTRTGAGTVVELLKRSGHLKDEDGMIVVDSPSHKVAKGAVESSRSGIDLDRARPTSIESSAFLSSTPHPFQISLSVEVKCTSDELDTLGERLRKVVDDFGKNSGATETDAENSGE